MSGMACRISEIEPLAQRREWDSGRWLACVNLGKRLYEEVRPVCSGAFDISPPMSNAGAKIGPLAQPVEQRAFPLGSLSGAAVPGAPEMSGLSSRRRFCRPVARP